MTNSLTNPETPYCKYGLVIAVSGLPGSGKSTLAKILADNLGLNYVSSGKLFREMAREKGMSLEEFTKYAELNHSIDKEIDHRALKEAMKGCAVIDGHIAAWVVKKYAHLKIFLKASREVRARRVSRRDRVPFKKALNQVVLRDESEVKRFREIYGIDMNDLSIFDLVINTEKFNVEGVFNMVLAAVKNFMRELNNELQEKLKDCSIVKS